MLQTGQKSPLVHDRIDAFLSQNPRLRHFLHCIHDLIVLEKHRNYLRKLLSYKEGKGTFPNPPFPMMWMHLKFDFLRWDL